MTVEPLVPLVLACHARENAPTVKVRLRLNLGHNIRHIIYNYNYQMTRLSGGNGVANCYGKKGGGEGGLVKRWSLLLGLEACEGVAAGSSRRWPAGVKCVRFGAGLGAELGYGQIRLSVACNLAASLPAPSMTI